MWKRKKIDSKSMIVIKNSFAALFVKGLSLIVSLFSTRAYISFFNDNEVLGIWYTIVAILQWILMFDLGLGNGLRNKLPKCIEENDDIAGKQYVSSTYLSMGLLSVFFCIFGFLLIPNIDWCNFLNVNESVLNNNIMCNVMLIVFIGIILQLVLKIIASILYALQLSGFVNSLTLISNLSILIFLLLFPNSGNLVNNLYIMSIVNVIAVNAPLIIVTVIIFSTKLRKMKPNIKFVEKDKIKEVLKIGVSLLWLQIIFMIISSTNEVLITSLTGAENTVFYNFYNKIFGTASQLFSLVLVPIWSMVTKAMITNDYQWIKKTYKRLLILSVGGFICLLFIVPFLQFVFDIWLGKDVVEANHLYAVIFSINGFMFLLHTVNTSISNGMSYFKPQYIFMTIAAIINIPLAIFITKLGSGWIGIVIVNIISLLVFEVMNPIMTFRYINSITLKG